MERILNRLLEAVRAEIPDALRLREKLHANPELGHQEFRTAEILKEALETDALSPLLATGLLVRVGPPKAGGIVVRAEMDGLPVQEATGVPYSAEGATMHACGHDVHMAALVALIRAARQLTNALPCPLIGLFQPSEEQYPSGAYSILQEGLLRREDPLAVVAAHVHPDVPWGTVSVDSGPVNASVDNLKITIFGRGGHAAYPHQTLDPIVALSQVIVSVQQVVSRQTDPMKNVVLTIGWVKAGSTENVVPDRAEAGGTLRVLQPDIRADLVALIREVVNHTAQATGCRADVEFIEGEPALVNNESLVLAIRETLLEVGIRLGPSMRSCGADDFGFYGQLAPAVMMFVGLHDAPKSRQVPLHHPQFLPPGDAVLAVAQAQAAAFVATAQHRSVADTPHAIRSEGGGG